MKQIMSLVVLAVVFIFQAACSSPNKNKAEKIETGLGNSTDVGASHAVGVKEGNVVVQRKVMLSEELRKLERDVFELETELYGRREYGSVGMRGAVKECFAKLADPKLGGNGKLTPVEAEDRLTTKEQDMKFGIDEKNALVGVSEEFLNDRLNRFKGYKKIYEGRREEFMTRLDVCENDIKVARNRTKPNE